VVAQSAEALADAVAEELARPSDPYPLNRLPKWGWDERVLEYVRVISEVTDGSGQQP
jgi:hypothetical protein